MLLRVALSKSLQHCSGLVSDTIQPEEGAFNSVARLCQINYDADGCVCKTATLERRLQQVSKVATTTELIHIGLHFFVIVHFQAALKLQSGSFSHIFLDLLIEELVDQRSAAALLLTHENERLGNLLCLGHFLGGECPEVLGKRIIDDGLFLLLLLIAGLLLLVCLGWSYHVYSV